jgi:2-polyprenyl-3-methyl-5-hydroxy-6-metoxy-1,4-benzoquinol methylase
VQTERLSVPANVTAARRASPWWGVHAARYLYASKHALDGPLLDIACGTGYGALFLGADRLLVGADVDADAVRSAAATARDARLGQSLWTVANGTELPFGDRAFATITSFETLEHVEQRTAFVRELARVVRADGLLMLSTPNAYYTRPVDGIPKNPFHLHEYTPEELTTELTRHFTSVELLGQTLARTFKVSPFADDWELRPQTPAARAQLLAWRVLNKTPVPLREQLSRTLWRRDFYPTEHDYVFGEDTVRDAPVLLAVCRGPRPA